MKPISARWAALLVLPALCLPARVARASDDWFGPDKALHFGASAIISGGGYALGSALFARRPLRLALGFGMGIGAGAAKELYDASGGGDASWRDFTWDVIGATTGTLIAWLIDVLVSGAHEEAHAPAVRVESPRTASAAQAPSVRAASERIERCPARLIARNARAVRDD